MDPNGLFVVFYFPSLFSFHIHVPEGHAWLAVGSERTPEDQRETAGR